DGRGSGGARRGARHLRDPRPDERHLREPARRLRAPRRPPAGEPPGTGGGGRCARRAVPGRGARIRGPRTGRHHGLVGRRRARGGPDRRARGAPGPRRGPLRRGRLRRGALRQRPRHGRTRGGAPMSARYILGEILTGLWRNIAMVISVVIVTAVSLTFVGTGALMEKQIMDMKSTLVEQSQVTIFLCSPHSTAASCAGGAATDAQIDSVREALEGDVLSPYIASYSERSQQQALE